MNALQASDYTIWIMLTISLSARVLRITFARKDEAAGNSEPPSRAPGLQARRGLRTFGGESQMPHSVGTSMFLVRMSLLRGPKVRKEIASLSGAAAGLLQSFITSFASSVSHKSLP